MLRATALALALASVFTASAQANGLTAEQVVEVATVTVDASGLETRTYTTAELVSPGDEVRYSLSYSNSGAQAAEGVNLVMPVPSDVTYIEASADGALSTITYSADGGDRFVAREVLIIGEGPDARPASADEITHIKWALSAPIPAASEGAISFRAVLK